MPTHLSTRFVSRRVGHRRGARAAAVLALLVGLVGWALVAWGIVDNLVLTLALVLIAPLFLGSVFTAITSTGPRRTIAIIVVVLLGVFITVSIVVWNLSREGWRYQGVVGVALLLVSSGLARYALTIPPPSFGELFDVPPSRRTTRRGVLIVNLRSGGGKAEEVHLPDRCADLGIEVVILEAGADLQELAREVAATEPDAIGMAGGDGSLGCVAQAAVEHGIPFVCVPAGTRNHLALDLGLDRTDPVQALAAFIDGEHRRIDYATVNRRLFVNNVSLGMYAAIVEQESYRDAKLETALELLPELAEQGGPWFDLHFDVPDHGRLEQAVILQVSNNPYVLAGEVGRRLRLDGGELGLVTVDPKHLGDLVGLTVLTAVRKPELSSALWSWTETQFEVQSGQPELAAGVDGETVVLSTPLRFELVPGGLDVLVPAGTRVGLEEQHLGLKGTYRGLFEVALGLDGS